MIRILFGNFYAFCVEEVVGAVLERRSRIKMRSYILVAAVGRLKTLGRIGLIGLIVAVNEAYACRIIDPIPMPRPIILPPQSVELKPITTKYHSAEITIKNQVAEIKVNATFYNPNSFRMEGTYWFPLPAEAAVKDFEMEINGKLVKGELLDAKRARSIYEDIVRRQKDPALLEWVGSQMLKCRVFPMEANKETKVTLTYTHMLTKDADLVRLNYPLRSAKPSAGTIDQLVVKIEIESDVPLKTIYSPTQEFDISRKGDNKALLTFEAKNVDPDRDVEVLFSHDASDVGLSVVSHKPDSEDGYFLLTVTPKVEIEMNKVIKKDIIFVCDTSGSMNSNDKIMQAKEALTFCVNTLNKGDRFNIIGFSGDVRYFKKELVECAHETVKEAEQYIDSMKAVGGTALNDALLAAMEVAKDAKNVTSYRHDMMPMIVFLTDGNPTIGEQNVETILKNVKDVNKIKCRLFVFGVGYDVNTKLLDTLAEENRGVREYVKPKEDIEVKVSNFYTKISSPVLSDVKVDFGGVEVDQTYPKKLPDLFHGSQLTMLGRFKSPGKHTVKLIGEVGDEARQFSYPVEFKDTKSDDYLPRMWALRKVAFLLDEIRLHGENNELIEEVTRLGKLHGILTPYTSFLVVEEGAPIDTTMRKEFEEAAKFSRGSFAVERRGRDAVADSANIALQKSADKPAGAQACQPQMFGIHAYSGHLGGTAGEEKAEEFDKKLSEVVRKTIRQIGSRTFYIKADGTWVDSAYDEKDKAKIKEVKLWSDEFFELVKNHPEIGRVLAETQKLIICVDGQIYRVGYQGQE